MTGARAGPPDPLRVGPLALLGVACFTAVLTETLPIGMLPLMAAGFGVSESRIGLLVSVYAAAVVVASIPLNAWTSRWPRRPLLLALLAVYALSNLVLVLSGSYAVAAGARVLGGLAHALFFAVLFGYASALAPRERIGTALAIAGSGSSVAVAIGTPLGAALGTAIGWRGTFAVVTGLIVVIAVLVRRWLPALPGSVLSGGDQLRQVLSRPAFLGLELAVVLIMVGAFAGYTYLTPIMIAYGFTLTTVPLALLGYGVAILAGLTVFSRFANRRLRPALVVALLGHSAVLFALAVLPRTLPVAVVLLLLWGLSFGAVPVFVQTGVIRAGGFPETASAIHNAVFNVGIGGGALLGALVLTSASAPAIGFWAAPVEVLAVPLCAWFLGSRWLTAPRGAETAR
ncbi:MAG: MFS transporter [Propionibacteriaceae bacterium]